MKTMFGFAGGSAANARCGTTIRQARASGTDFIGGSPVRADLWHRKRLPAQIAAGQKSVEPDARGEPRASGSKSNFYGRMTPKRLRNCVRSVPLIAPSPLKSKAAT